MAIITHIVSFKYTTSTSQTEKEFIGSKFLALKDSCERNGEKYILELTGGANASPEGLNDGFEHAFVATFASEEDRDYYLKDCPAHQLFKEGLEGKLEKIFVVDFAGGRWSCE